MSPILRNILLFVVAFLISTGIFFYYFSTAKEEKLYIEWGILTCNVSGNSGYILANELTMDCVMLTHDGKISCYEGTLSRFGLDIGVTLAKTQVWSILAVAKTPRDTFLNGSYLGMDVGASFLVGGGAAMKFGGFDNSFVLVPISLYVQSGINVTTSFTYLDLKSVEMNFSS